MTFRYCMLWFLRYQQFTNDSRVRVLHFVSDGGEKYYYFSNGLFFFTSKWGSHTRSVRLRSCTYQTRTSIFFTFLNLTSLFYIFLLICFVAVRYILFSLYTLYKHAKRYTSRLQHTRTHARTHIHSPCNDGQLLLLSTNRIWWLSCLFEWWRALTFRILARWLTSWLMPDKSVLTCRSNRLASTWLLSS